LVADAAGGKVEVVHPLNGGVLDRRGMFDFMRVMDLEKQAAFFWGDRQQLMELDHLRR
jgi:hypothetical protein